MRRTRALFAACIMFFMGSVFAEASKPGAIMPPGRNAAATADGVSGYQPSRPKASAISPAGAKRVEIPAPKSSPVPSDSRLNMIGHGRLLAELGGEELDVATLPWTSESGLRVARLLVKSAGAGRLRVGLRVRADVSGLIAIRVSGASGADPLDLSFAQLYAARDGGTVWTPVTNGEAQLVEFTTDASGRLPKATLFVVGVSHMDAGEGPRRNEKALGSSLSCQIDVVCVDQIQGLDSSIKAAFDNKVASTAMLIITKDSGETVTCSGTLLNNDYKVAVFLTAFHCIGSPSEANSTIARWNFQANDCPATTYNPGTDKTSGALWLNGSQELDETLIGLRDTPPSNAVLSGWDATGFYPAGAQMLGMHHPRGDLKKTSLGTITGLQTTPFSVEGIAHQGNEFYTTGWQIGLVESGSSGSGLFVQPANQTFFALVGSLFAGPSTVVCSGAKTYTNIYSRLDLFFPSVRRFFQSNYSLNYTDLWWNPSESGWGLNVQHQGDTIFATWFTYGPDGKGMWIVMSNGQKVSTGVYQGALYLTTGTPFSQINGQTAADFPLQQVGNGTLTFNTSTSGTFSYTAFGVTATKAIQRQVFAPPAPSCSFSLSGRGGASNYQDLWWNPNESGWGLNVTHQGGTIFATWFTYDLDRSGMWLVMSNGTSVGPNTYQGTLYRTTGKPFSQINGQTAANFPLPAVGTLKLTFTDGQNGRMDYSVNGVSGSKAIQRQVFSQPYTICQ